MNSRGHTQTPQASRLLPGEQSPGLSSDERQLERDIAWCKGVVDDTSRSRLARYTACKLMAALIAERTPHRVRQMEQERGLA